MRLPFALPFRTAVLIFPLLLQPISAFVSLCSAEFGHPKEEDCIAAVNQVPILRENIFFEPRPAASGSTECPAVIKHKTCRITVRCSSRIAASWLMLRALGHALIKGDHSHDALSHVGCVMDLGIGGVGTPHFPNDPIWVEVSETGVPGPPEDGIAAPLLKGVNPSQLERAGLTVPHNLPGSEPVTLVGDLDSTGKPVEEEHAVLFLEHAAQERARGTFKASGARRRRDNLEG